MEQKLEKVCSLDEIKVGERYCLGQYIVSSEFIFEIVAIYRDYVRIEFLDGLVLLLGQETMFQYYKFPYSSLEKELA